MRDNSNIPESNGSVIILKTRLVEGKILSISFVFCAYNESKLAKINKWSGK